jgi:nitric oxide reductase activation protein
MSLWTWLAIVACVIVVVLAGVAGSLLVRLYRLRSAQAKKLTEQALASDLAVRERRLFLNRSIQILAQALAQNELSSTEASMRIAMLLDSLDVTAAVRTEFSAFYQLREVTVHIPILEAWASLSVKQQRQYDIERLQQEATYGDFVADAAKRIQGREF